MKIFRGLAGLALLTAIAVPTARAAYTVDYFTARTFPQKAGATGSEVSGNLRGIDVNTNVGSPYYGYVYICDLTTVSTGQTAVLIYKPVNAKAGTSAEKYEDTGKKILVNTDTSQFTSLQGGHGVSVGPDDTVWVCDFSARQIESAPPVPPGEDATVVATPVINLATYDTLALAELPAGWTVGHPRNLHVARTQTALGPVDVILVANNTGDGSATDQTIQKFTLAAGAPVYTWTRPIADLDNDPDVNDSQNGTGYDVTCDDAGNVYIPLRAASGEVNIRKLDPLGNEVAFANPPRSPFQWTGANETGTQTVPVDANFPGIAYVKDPTVGGGGYLYVLGRAGARQHGGRYDLNGNLLEPMGNNFRNNPASQNLLGYLEADDTGNFYIRLGSGTANANMLKVFPSHDNVITGGAVKSSPSTSMNGVTYFGSNDGKLYAIDDATGSAPAGTMFPVDIQALAGGTLLGRPAVRYTLDGWYVYFATSNGGIGRIPVSGDTSAAAGAWLSAPLMPGAANVAVTPAVTDSGLVYVAIGDGSSASLFRLDATTGTSIAQQPLTPATTVQSSPSVINNNIYVGTDEGTFRVLDSGGSFVLSTSAGGATSGSPFVDLASATGPTMYVVDNGGTVFARNATNFAPIVAFNGNGEAPLGASVQSSLFAWNNTLYIGGMDNKVYAVNEADGSGAGPAGYVFFDAGAGSSITKGVAVSPGGPGDSINDPGGLAVIFGSTNGRYYQVRASDPTVYRATAGRLPFTGGSPNPQFPNPSAFDTAPSVDTKTNTDGGVQITEFIGNDDGRIYRLPRF